MKKLVLSTALLLTAGFTFAQEDAVKQAKRLMNSGDLSQAETLIEGAVTNAETKDLASTWNLAGKIQQKIYDEEMKKAYIAQPFDTARMHNSNYKMIEYFLQCDELEQIPNEKGKVKFKFRKDDAAAIVANRPALVEGGNYYYTNGDDKSALKFWGMYIDLAEKPILADMNIMKVDTFIPMIAYYSTVSALRAEDYDAVLKYSKFACNHPEFGEDVTDFTLRAYLAKGDSAQWLASLKESITKYPDNQFFFASLIDYYVNSGNLDEALNFGESMLQKHPDDPNTIFVVGYIYQSLKKYDKAVELYKKAIELDPTSARSYSYLGRTYFDQAAEAERNMPIDINDPDYAKYQEARVEFLKLAKPYYEKARELAPDQKILWVNELYLIYYNLNLPEFEEIEQIRNAR